MHRCAATSGRLTIACSVDAFRSDRHDGAARALVERQQRGRQRLRVAVLVTDRRGVGCELRECCVAVRQTPQDR